MVAKNVKLVFCSFYQIKAPVKVWPIFEVLIRREKALYSRYFHEVGHIFVTYNTEREQRHLHRKKSRGGGTGSIAMTDVG